jgi:uncharacterized protein YciI
MLYLIYGEDRPDSEKLRAPHRAEHILRREELADAGLIVVSGPLTDNDGATAYSGSCLVAEFPSYQAAKAWALADPYVRAGVYERVVVKRIVKHFPK